MHAPRTLGPALIVVALVTSASCGADDGADRAGPGVTNVDVTMVDNAFEPAEITVPAGEEVTFTFTNEGAVDHEALIGTEADQEDHGAAMADGSGDHGMDGDPDHGDMDGSGMDGSGMGDTNERDAMSEAITVRPGETRSMTMTFDESGSYEIGCHVPGHYEAGMKATIEVG